MQTFKEYYDGRVSWARGMKYDDYFAALTEAFQSYVDEVIVPSMHPPRMADAPLDVNPKPGAKTMVTDDLQR